MLYIMSLTKEELIEMGFSQLKQHLRTSCNVFLPYAIIVIGVASTIVSSFIKVDDLKANTILNNYLNITTSNGPVAYNSTSSMGGLENIFTIGDSNTQLILIKAFNYLTFIMGFMMLIQKWLNDKKSEVVKKKVTILEAQNETIKEHLTNITMAGLTARQSINEGFSLELPGSQMLSPYDNDSRNERGSNSTDYPRPFTFQPNNTNNEPIV